MTDEISNILGLNKGRVNLTKYMTNEPKTVTNVAQNRLQNTVEYTKNKVSNAQEAFGKMSTTNKILIIVGVIVLFVIIGLIIKFYRDQRKREEFLSQPLFMTEIEQGEPHNTKKIYRYTDPNTGRTTPYIPSNNFDIRNGSEFTFSYWMFIDGKGWDYRFGEWKHIFHRGTSPIIPIDGTNAGANAGTNEDITKLTVQMPSFWLSPKENTLNCSLTTGESGEERIALEDVPINKWINIVLVVDGNSASLYMDGKMYRTINLMNKINITKDAVYVNYFGGFAGKMAYLQYFNRALTPQEIQNLYREFKKIIDKYIESEKSGRMIDVLVPPTVDKQECNYMAFIKQEKDKEMYINKIVDLNTVLCKNTKGMTETECNVENKKLRKMIGSGMPITEIKARLDKMVESVKPVNESVYKYVDESGKTRMVYLTNEEYQKIRK